MKAFKSFFKWSFILSAASMLFVAAAHAQTPSPVGYWQTMDENTQQPNSVVQVTVANGELQGKVVKLYNNPDAVCSECSGAMHNKPVMGMPVLWGFTQQGDQWVNGKVLSIQKGKVYNANAHLDEQGQKLVVVVSVFGSKHPVTWTRVSDAAGTAK